MSKQPRRQVDSPRKLTTRPATTPITTISSGHWRSDRAAALASDRRGTSHQMFGAFDDIGQQHGAGHGPDTARHRRDPASDLRYARIKITNESGVGTRNADVDADGTRFDHVRSEESRPTCRRNYDVGLSGMPGEIDGSGVAQRHCLVFTLAGQQQSERPANSGPAADDANLRPIELDVVAAEQLDNAARRTRQRTGFPQHQLAKVDGVE